MFHIHFFFVVNVSHIVCLIPYFLFSISHILCLCGKCITYAFLFVLVFVVHVSHTLCLCDQYITYTLSFPVLSLQCITYSLSFPLLCFICITYTLQGWTLSSSNYELGRMVRYTCQHVHPCPEDFYVLPYGLPWATWSKRCQCRWWASPHVRL